MRQTLVITALAGLFAAVLVGIGEYLLHFDELARFSISGYDFLLDTPVSQTTLGHFLGVFGATLYPIGCYHIYLMLKPAKRRLAFSVFIVGTFGFIVGAVWIGSRASVTALVQLEQTPQIIEAIELYGLRYETLLQVIRFTTLYVSVVIIWLSLSGRSHYPRWMALFNPIGLIILNFVVFMLAPAVGKHSMPIALNVAFFIFFALSLACALTTSINAQSGTNPPQ